MMTSRLTKEFSLRWFDDGTGWLDCPLCTVMELSFNLQVHAGSPRDVSQSEDGFQYPHLGVMR